MSEDIAYELVAKHWNASCVPPWSDDELHRVLDNAVAYRQNDIGAKAALPVSQVFAEALEQLPKDERPRGRLLRSVSFADLMLRPCKPIEEIVPGLIEKGIATMLAGHGGTHKSRFAQQLGLSIQAGVPIFGKVAPPCTFVYLDYENGEAEITRRTHKMRARLKLPNNTAGHYFDMKNGAMDPTKGPLPASEMSPPLALIEDAGVTCLPLYFEVYDFLRLIPGHKFVVADSCYNLLNFTGQTKINESAVKSALTLLDYLCAATNSTMIYLWHPSQSGLERGDASGWSVAWNNTPRARLSLTAVKNVEDAFTLAVEKRNNGPKGQPITLHWDDGILLPRSEVDTAQQSTLFLEACVKVAVTSAENTAPITRQRNLDGWQIDEIERGAGYRPSQREIKDQLARALGLGRLRYVKGYGKQQAGYFPIETDPVLHRLTGIDSNNEARPST